jgi:predicted amidophosphoribosyltransferase
VGALRATNETLHLVHLLKYGGMTRLARPLGRILTETIPSGWIGRTVVVAPVPLHPSRERERGYNQSALLAAEVADRLMRPLRVDLLRRSRRTPPQALLSPDRRADNVSGAFQAVATRVPAEGAVLLIDDVLTTGATLLAATRALRAAGTSEVFGATLVSAGSSRREENRRAD